jgi:hypothetical protein
MAYWIQHEDLYKLVPMKSSSVLPDEGFEPRPIVLKENLPPFMVSCVPKALTPRQTHRVLVHCTCGRKIPFGRMTQHFRHHR